MLMTLEKDSAFTRPPAYIKVGENRIAYRRLGQGEPLLMVHGYPLHGMTFRHVAPLLARDYTCIIPDLPGLGATEWSDKTDFSFAGQAATLKAFIDALDVSSYSILAHDTGATIARRLTTTDLGRVRKLILIGTEIPDHRPPWIPLLQKISNPNNTGSYRRLMGKRWFRHSSAAFGGCFFDPGLIDGDFFDIFIDPVLNSDRAIQGQSRYLRGIDWALVDGLRQEHARITMPSLLIWGREDTVFPLEEARRMARQLPDCRGLAVISDARLFVQEERPAEVAEAALSFLKAA